MRSSGAISRRKRPIYWLVKPMPPCFTLIEIPSPDRKRANKNPETGTESVNSGHWSFLGAIRSGVSGFPRCIGTGARLDLDRLGGLYGLRGLLDREA
jgi:hypothetical protein